MRTGQLDHVFDNEEQEFLYELVESAREEAQITLLGHQEEPLEDVDDIEAMSSNVARQKRRIAFLDLLYMCLQGGGK